mmetsp:Transcript_14547/g.50679  ORF Transcript_14547/g.50679 Transcript_14547/m.50679 type:complete len:362 (-) Transcript_14547:4-1089(-)
MAMAVTVAMPVAAQINRAQHTGVCGVVQALGAERRDGVLKRERGDDAAQERHADAPRQRAVGIGRDRLGEHVQEHARQQRADRDGAEVVRVLLGHAGRAQRDTGEGHERHNEGGEQREAPLLRLGERRVRSGRAVHLLVVVAGGSARPRLGLVDTGAQREARVLDRARILGAVIGLVVGLVLFVVMLVVLVLVVARRHAHVLLAAHLHDRLAQAQRTRLPRGEASEHGAHGGDGLLGADRTPPVAVDVCQQHQLTTTPAAAPAAAQQREDARVGLLSGHKPVIVRVPPVNDGRGRGGCGERGSARERRCGDEHQQRRPARRGRSRARSGAHGGGDEGRMGPARCAIQPLDAAAPPGSQCVA